jgi:hypothetical protein
LLVADLFSGVLIFVFGSAAVGKLLRQRQQVQTAEKLRIPWDRYRWIAVPEAAASVGLLIGYAIMPFATVGALLGLAAATAVLGIASG